MLVNDDIIDIEKPDGICSPTFVVDEFLELFLHPSIFSRSASRLKIWKINNNWFSVGFMVLIKL